MARALVRLVVTVVFPLTCVSCSSGGKHRTSSRATTPPSAVGGVAVTTRTSDVGTTADVGNPPTTSQQTIGTVAGTSTSADIVPTTREPIPTTVPGTTTEGPQTRVLTIADSIRGGQVTGHVGDTFRVELVPCCGDSWVVAEAPNPAIVASLGASTTPSPTSVAGQSGSIASTQTFTYKCVGSGTTGLAISEIPPVGNMASQTFSIRFTISS